MTAGRLFLLLRQFSFAPGPIYTSSLIFNRIRWRNLILSSKPIAITRSGACDVHLLVSHTHIYEAIWATKSLYIYDSARDFNLFIHDDGTLRRDDYALLARHFPGVFLVERHEADKLVARHLEKRCQELRKNLVLALKLFDFALYSEGRPYICLDTDVLFFKNPLALVSGVLGNKLFWYNEDPPGAVSFSHSPEIIYSKTGLAPKRFNSGLLTVPANAVSLRKCEIWLQSLGQPAMQWTLEQTLYALLAAEHGCHPLPREYDIREFNEPDVTSQHYYWKSRRNMYRVVYPRLRGGALKSVWFGQG